jgi:hypothetical protein
MLKGKNLWIIAGVAVVGYYLWKKNQAAKVIAAGPTTAPINFTGDLGVPEYQNAYGVKVVKRPDSYNASGPSDRQLNRLERVMTKNPQRAQRMIKRMF